jgi:uncharacterized protein (DUF1684 family)
MAIRSSLFLLCIVVASACTGDKWPDPPPVDQVKYRHEYAELTKEQQETAAYALSLVGAWQLPDGDTPFGSDPGLPIVLPAKATAPRAGVFRRSGDSVTVIPERGVRLTREDGTVITTSARLDEGPPLVLGSVHLEFFSVPPSMMFLDGRDTDAPALQNVHVDAFPIDPRWRVAARFDAYDSPKTVKIATTRGTVNDTTAAGQLVFRLNGQEFRLTALDEPGSNQFFVMFKDDTNGSTTFSGYRMLSPKAVASGEWTVLDFNLARNPPCAYSKFTMCPLPPKENRLAVAVEAGVKRDPTARGYSE